ncbi:MAG: RIP metalloprotease RseP [Phycisphaerae bacterium]
MSTVLHLVEIAVAIGLLILVHELGHFLTAKWFGVRVRRFALGMGPVLVKWQRGDTEYSLRPIPIGGFVDLAGEHPEAEGADDPKALWRRPVWQRIVVFSAGVVMNALLAIVLFSAAFLVGVNVIAPVAGEILPGSPAEKAGIRAGDRVLALGVTGQEPTPIQAFDDLMYAVTLENAGTEFTIEIERPAAEGDEPVRKTFRVKSFRPEGSLGPMFGINVPQDTVLAKMLTTSPAYQAGLEVGDRILAVDGEPITFLHQAAEALEQAPAGPVVLTIKREGREQDLRIDPAELKEYRYGFAPPTGVEKVLPDSPAEKAGIQKADRVVQAGEVRWPTPSQISEVVQAAGTGSSVDLVLARGGERIEVTCQVAMMDAEDGQKPMIGLAMAGAVGDPVEIGQVEADGAAARAGLRPGDIILSVGPKGKMPGNWNDVVAELVRKPGAPVAVTVERGSQVVETTLTPDAVPYERFTLEGIAAKPVYVALPRIYNPLTAAGEGLKRTRLWFGRIYTSLAQMVRGQVSTQTVGGPVLIVQASLAIAEQGLGTLMSFWGMLGVSLAVLNFLPLPPFDGGHVLFAIIAKIKGSHVSLKVQTAFWAAGWVMVGLLILLVMWQDIDRLL